MRNIFFEFYSLSDERRKQILENGIIVLDTSALLNLYRYSKEVRNDLMNLLTNCKDRIWLPYQVGWEYHKNLHTTIVSVESACDNFIRAFNSAKSEFFKILNIKSFRHPVMKFTSLKDELNKCFDKILDEVKKSQDIEADKKDSEELKNKILVLYEDRIGKDFADSVLDEIYKEGANRYNRQIPPGYCDLKNKNDKSDREMYGDLVVWKQIMHHAKEQKSDVILITGDRKEDWFEVGKYERITARKELIKEFRQETGADILIYEFADFLNTINKTKSLNLEISTLEEVDEMSKSNRANFYGYNHTNDYPYMGGMDSPVNIYLKNNSCPNPEILTYLERLLPYELMGAQSTPLDIYLRANASHPSIEIIRYLERLLPYEPMGAQSKPLDTYLRANASHPSIEIVRYLERLLPYEIMGAQSTPLDTYLRTNAANPDIEVIHSLEGLR